MQKVSFTCENCGARGTVRLPDDCDDMRVEVCPCCGDMLPADDCDEDDDE